MTSPTSTASYSRPDALFHGPTSACSGLFFGAGACALGGARGDGAVGCGFGAACGPRAGPMSPSEYEIASPSAAAIATVTAITGPRFGGGASPGAVITASCAVCGSEASPGRG